MFGCFGLYHSGTFFGIICGEDLFFRTNESTRRKYIARRMEPLIFREHQKEHFYYRVPPKVIATEVELCSWAREAVQVQRDRLSEKMQSEQSRSGRAKQTHEARSAKGSAARSAAKGAAAKGATAIRNRAEGKLNDYI